MTVDMQGDLLRDAERLARTHMESYNDPSHDWLHVDRVRRLALRIAKDAAKTSPVDFLVVELAALFHDLHDSKYSAQTSSIWDGLHERFFGRWLDAGVIDEKRARLICQICENVSYSKEVKRIKANQVTSWHESCIELHCVCDADKLDAMGGIGIMRCAAFSAAKHRPLLEAGNPNDSISHFHDKLFKLKSMMRTDTGKRLAEKRHQAMVNFVKEVEDECADIA